MRKGSLANNARRALAVIVCLLALSGCAAGIGCGNTCDPGWAHNMYDCGCRQISPRPGPQQPPNSYYIIREYFCKHVSDGSDDGSCEVTRNSNSCQAALDGVNRYLAKVHDPCRICNGTVDTTIEWNNRWKDKQGGPCQGWSGGELNYSPVPQGFSPGFPRVLRMAVAATTDPVATCRLACDGVRRPESPACVQLRVLGREQPGLRRLQQLTATNPSSIKASEIRTMFNFPSDPCRRGDTTFRDGIVVNVGNGTCEMVTQLPGSNVTILVPELLQGKWTAGPSGVQAIFDDAQTRATLHFSNLDLDADWGGDIVGVFSERDYIGFSIGSKSCIRAALR
jgi:hypothetical protein